MSDYEVYQKVKEAIKAIEDYKKMLDKGESSLWKREINEGLVELNEKRHMLGSSGQACSCCGGSGRG
jgi:DNA integrity scanning protein DisA with diadenylate cyclase activity